MVAYYNENDKTAAAWLRELITAGLIAPGDVDERDIRNVRPSELTEYDQVHLFAGIGGWSYALRLAGWPDSKSVCTGSCPCQPFSQAGKGKGTDDPRHLWPEMRRLIKECQPSIVFGEQVASPAGRLWLDRVSADLEALGFAVGSADLCAAGIGAPHIRQRLWWVADSGFCGNECELRRTEALAESGETERKTQQRERCGANPGGACSTHRMANPRQQQEGRSVQKPGEGIGEIGERPSDQLGKSGGSNGMGDASGKRSQERVGNGSIQRETPGPSPWEAFVLASCRNGKQRRIEPGLEPLAHGVPGRVGLLRGYGNAIVPQLAAEFIGAYLDAIGND